MIRQLEQVSSQFQETAQFVERALIDFGLIEAFESRPSDERDDCLRWIDAAAEDYDQEYRVSQLLDDLAGRRPLSRLLD